MAEEQQGRKTQSGLGSIKNLSGKKTKKKKQLNADEFFEIVDSKKQFTGPKSTKGSLGDTINRFRDMQDKIVLKMKKGGRAKNTRRMNRLEELGRVDAEKAYTRKGKRNLKAEKKRIVRSLNSRGAAVRGHGKEIK
jgi:hypothetical protein